VVTEDAGTATEVRWPDHVPLVQIELLLVCHAVGKDHDRDLNDARTIEALAAAEGQFLARCEVFDVEPGFGGHPGEFGIDEACERCLFSGLPLQNYGVHQAHGSGEEKVAHGSSKRLPQLEPEEGP